MDERVNKIKELKEKIEEEEKKGEEADQEKIRKWTEKIMLSSIGLENSKIFGSISGRGFRM